MAQLTADISRKYKVDNADTRVEQPVDAGVVIYENSMVGINPATSFARQLVAGDVFAGFADAQAANIANAAYPNLAINGIALGSAAALSVMCRSAGVLVVPLASVAGAVGYEDVGIEVFASDGNTLTMATYSGTLTVTGIPTGGTFTLTVAVNNSTQTTAAIAYNATAAVVQAALVALSNVSGAVVTGAAGGPYTVVWSGNTPTVTLGTNSLTGGTAPSVTVGAIALVGTLSKIGVVQNYNVQGTGYLEIYFQSSVRRVP